MKLRWDIFCTVIDNFGDIGVAWRLARQLSAEYGQAVRLWVDDLKSFHALESRLDSDCDSQLIGGIEIRHWRETLEDIEPAQVVIEALACRLPEAYLQAMASMSTKPVWINLEYLSAEDWVKDCHGLTSLHPRLPLTQMFMIPGFGPHTGGLLGSFRQHQELAAWRMRAGERERFFSGMGIEKLPDDALTVSLFAYDNPAIPGLLDALADLSKPAFLIVPESRASARVASWLGAKSLHSGSPMVRGRLVVQSVPFLDHERYDHLLWACDLNCVRGEDSFMQAQWAARPLVWQAYVQQDGAHWKKLQAFLASYQAGLRPDTAELLTEAWRIWNAGELNPGIWRDYLGKMPELTRHATEWEGKIRSWPNLADELVKFALSKIQSPVF